jgi:hypothetical protein
MNVTRNYIYIHPVESCTEFLSSTSAPELELDGYSNDYSNNQCRIANAIRTLCKKNASTFDSVSASLSESSRRAAYRLAFGALRDEVLLFWTAAGSLSLLALAAFLRGTLAVILRSFLASSLAAFRLSALVSKSSSISDILRSSLSPSS